MYDWLLRQWRDISGNFKFWVLTILGAALVTAAIALTHGLYLWQQVTLAMLFLILFAWAILGNAKLGQKKTRITPDNLESYVRNWLDGFELVVRRIADPACHFLFETVTASGTPLGVMRLRTDDQYLGLVSRLQLGAEHREIYNGLSAGKKKKFHRNVRLEAVKAKIELVVKDEDGPAILITILQRLPITENLTQADFLGAVNEINFSAILVKEVISLGLETQGEDEPPKPELVG